MEKMFVLRIQWFFVDCIKYIHILNKNMDFWKDFNTILNSKKPANFRHWRKEARVEKQARNLYSGSSWNVHNQTKHSIYSAK